MIKKLDVFLNRIYYALYSFNHYFVRAIGFCINMTLGKLLYGLPFVRRGIRKTYGITSFDGYCKIAEQTVYNLMVRTTSGAGAFYMSYLSTLLFSLPNFLLIHLWLLLGGMPAWHIYGKGLFLFVLLGTVPSWILCEKVFWKKDRYLKYFKKFEKESRVRKVLWAIGVMLTLVLLIVANLALMGIADEIHGFHPKPAE